MSSCFGREQAAPNIIFLCFSARWSEDDDEPLSKRRKTCLDENKPSTHSSTGEKRSGTWSVCRPCKGNSEPITFKQQLFIFPKFLVFRLRSQTYRVLDGRPGVHPSHLKIQPAGDKGLGVFATALIQAGRWVCEYTGQLISDVNKPKGTRKQPPDLNTWTKEGNFSFFFWENDRWWCIDAADPATAPGPGRFINHVTSKTEQFNLKSQLVKLKGKKPAIWFKAVKDIVPGEELLYRYGENDPETICQNQWLQ